MASRKDQREQARAEREQREAEDAARSRRKTRLGMLLGAVAIAAVIVVAVVLISQSGDDSGGGGGTTAPSNPNELFAGIPQDRVSLGRPNAPVTMVEFADLQCPFCAQFETQMFPKIVNRYVKPGKLKVVFQPIAIIGSDSVAGARASASAGQQNKMFDYASLFYLNQGQENTGYVTDSFLTNLANAVPGLDVSKWKADLNSQGVNSMLSQAQSAAQTARVDSTPTFLVAKRGQPLTRFDVSEYTQQAFYPKLDSLTK